MNRIDQLFQTKRTRILNVYCTAGFPELNSLPEIVSSLDASGADIIEIGMPYSDPLADGKTIQQSSSIALQNGLTLPILFNQLATIREHTQKPLILMGYLNQMLQYGLNAFCEQAENCGIDGFIIPDMPLHSYEEEYREIIEKHNLHVIFLITPRTPDHRIQKIDELSKGFIYLVADSSITGTSKGISKEQTDYFQRISALNLNNPLLAGFGISTKQDFETVCEYLPGAIIGSAFIRHLQAGKKPEDFVKAIIS